jgi:large subunit ribosomal protein L30
MAERDNIFLVRVRGRVNISKEKDNVFRMLHLPREYHGTIIDNRPSYLGMIQKIKDYSTWGEVFQNSISLLLTKRGRLKGNKKLTDQFAREILGYKSIEDLAKAINDFKISIKEVHGLKPVFRLHPPKGGFRNKKNKAYPKGELGYRGENIKKLIFQMV